MLEKSKQNHLRSVILPRNIKAATSHRRVFAIVLIKFPTLSDINHKRGYEAGDFLLSQAWFRLLSLSKSADCLHRYSGSKFCLVLPLLVDASVIELVLSKLEDLMSTSYSFGGESISFPYKCGAGFSEDGFHNSEDLLKSAEQALKEAANSHLNWKVQCVNSDAKFNLGDLYSGIRNALHNNELELFFQPKISLGSGCCIGFESLIRWEHAGTYVSPDLFIPYAEKSDLIFMITNWSIHNAARQLKKLDALSDSNKSLSISINISGQCLTDESIFQSIKNTLAIWDITPGRFILEITETAFLEDLERAAVVCNRLRDEVGVQISLDDFGTGFSSLEILRCVQTDEIKIDKTFVNQIHQDFRCLKIVENIISLGESLDISVVAEGVENEVVLNKLKSLTKCQVQGFLFSKPLRSSQLVNWLKYDARRWRASINLRKV